MEHAQTCPSPPDVTVMTQSLMTQQPASTPDVSIVVMTKSSSKVLGRFPTIKYITGRWLSYRKANSKIVRIFARQKFPGIDRGSGYSSLTDETQKQMSCCLPLIVEALLPSEFRLFDAWCWSGGFSFLGEDKIHI
jgi:hypothetical protein